MTNVHCILNKLSEFDLFVNYHRPDIIALSETWLCDKTSNSLFACSQYYIVYRCDRLTRSGGGVCLFLTNYHNVNIQQLQLTLFILILLRHLIKLFTKNLMLSQPVVV
jgi:hypothetical protein